MAKLKLQNTYKHLIKFTGDSSIRPALSGIHFTQEGDIEATNSHILLKLFNRVPENNEMILDPKTLTAIDATYPDTSNVIATYADTRATLTRLDIAELTKFMKNISSPESVIRVQIAEGKLYVESYLNLSLERVGDVTEVEVRQTKDDFECYFKASYLKIMLDFLADCATEEVEIQATSNVRPVFFEVFGDFIGMIAPVRVTKPDESKNKSLPQ